MIGQVTCHTNAKVSFLALDSLRQLAMRFLEKEELANFKFQKDFLKPFEYAMVHNNHPDARDMVLQCLHQMIQARVQNLRSGWRTMFGVFAAAAKATSERTVVQAFDLVQRVVAEHFSAVVEYGSFADLTVCVTDFCKISKYQRVSLQAIELLKSLIPKMLTCPACPLSEAVLPEATATDDPMLKFWFPILFAFYDVIMNGEDMEVRKRCVHARVCQVPDVRLTFWPFRSGHSIICLRLSRSMATPIHPSSGTRCARRCSSQSSPSCGHDMTCPDLAPTRI